MNAMLGLALVLLAGGLAGSYILPLKKTVKWAWETTWLVWALVALIIIPWTCASITVPGLGSVYMHSSVQSLVRVFLFGALWGLGALLFSQSTVLIGMGLTYAICIGLTTALGSLIPMMKDPHTFLTSAGMTLTGGVVLMILGVVVCAVAGIRKDAQAKTTAGGEQASSNAPSGNFVKGLTFAILGGIFSSMINLAFSFSGGIMEVAKAAGASDGGAADAVWAIALTGGFVTNCVYCCTLLTRNKTWSGYRRAGSANHWLLAILMGALWVSSLIVYGRGAGLMGYLGKSTGWAVYMGTCVLVSNAWGLITGEWKEGKGKPIRIMYGGIALLSLAIVVIGYANSLTAH